MSELGSSPAAFACPQLVPAFPEPCLQHSGMTPGPLLSPSCSAAHTVQEHRPVLSFAASATQISPLHYKLLQNWFLRVCPSVFLGPGQFRVQHCAKKLCSAAKSVLLCAVFPEVMIVVMPICILEHKTESHMISHCSSERWGMFAI